MPIRRKCIYCHNYIDVQKDVGTYIYQNNGAISHIECFSNYKKSLKVPWSQRKINEYIGFAQKQTKSSMEELIKEEQKKKVLHNTKLLMKNYNSLKLHADKAIYSVNDVEDLQEYDDQDKAYILSIRRSRTRTIIMVAHIEMALEELKNKKVKKGCYEQYKALELYYIDKVSYEEIQEELNCSKNTPSRWINSAIKDLSILLFGVDSIKLEDVG